MSIIAVVASPRTYIASLGAMTDSYARMGEAYETNPAMGDYAQMHTALRLCSTDLGDVRLCAGRYMAADDKFTRMDDVRIVYLPSFEMRGREDLEQLLRDSAPFHAWLGRQAQAGSVIGACGASVCHLAAAGLLDGKECTVHPRLVSTFRRLFPKVQLDRAHPVSVSGNVMTCGRDADNGVLVIRLIAEAFSLEVAEGLVLREPYGDAFEQWGSGTDPVVMQAQLWIRDRFTGDFRIADMADELGLSHQALIRRFRDAGLGTPRGYAQKVRVQAAASMLEETNRTIIEIAQLVGYSDIPSFRRVFTEQVGMAPGAYRQVKKMERIARIMPG